MLSPYRDLLATPGGLRFSAAAFVARLPISMIGLGIVLLVVAETGRYSRAGALSATAALVNAASAPLMSRLVDRVGQRRVLLPAVPLHCTALVGFVVLVSVDAPTWLQVLVVVIAAMAAPSIESLVRARWGFVLGRGTRLHTAYAFESVLDEGIFVLGPLVVSVLATVVAAQAGLVTAGALLAAGTAALVSHRASEPPPATADEAHPSALRSPGLPVLMTMAAFLGGVFGAVELSTVAFADHVGHRVLAGPLLACYAGGSMLAGLVFGALRLDVAPRRTLLLGSAVMTATAVLLPFVGATPLLAVVLFLAGLGIAPTLISALSLVERVVPAAAVTEGLTWATTSLVVGLSATTWLAGRLVDGAGVPWAFTVAAVSGALALAVARAGYTRLPA